VAEAQFASSGIRESKAEHSSSSRVPAHNIRARFSQWEDGAGLALHEWI
jgi:hypothetical protein